MVSDEVADMIASIAVERQATEKEKGAAAARATALGRLQELLGREEEALRLEGPGNDRMANIEAVKLAIGRLKTAAAGGSRPPSPHQNNRGPGAGPRRDPPHHQMRNRGRRTMGRGGR